MSHYSSDEEILDPRDRDADLLRWGHISDGGDVGIDLNPTWMPQNSTVVATGSSQVQNAVARPDAPMDRMTRMREAEKGREQQFVGDWIASVEAEDAGPALCDFSREGGVINSDSFDRSKATWTDHVDDATGLNAGAHSQQADDEVSIRNYDMDFVLSRCVVLRKPLDDRMTDLLGPNEGQSTTIRLTDDLVKALLYACRSGMKVTTVLLPADVTNLLASSLAELAAINATAEDISTAIITREEGLTEAEKISIPHYGVACVLKADDVGANSVRVRISPPVDVSEPKAGDWSPTQCAIYQPTESQQSDTIQILTDQRRADEIPLDWSNDEPTVGNDDYSGDNVLMDISTGNLF